MAKKAYIGINNTAHKIKKGYIGILTDQSGEVETTITTDNINSYFTVTNGEYTFVGSGSIFTTTEEARAKTSTITLTALEAFPISFEYTIYSHFAQNDSFSITVAGTTVVDILCDDVSMPYTKSWSGSVNTGDAITITLTKSGRVYTGDDLKASFQKMIITQNVSKPAAEVARKIKKAYIGIGGVARPCWSGGELAYYGTITSLSSARLLLAATTIGDYALFGGGMASGNTNGLATVDAYTKSLTRSTPTALGVARHTLASTSVGEYALFCGGESGTAKKNTVDTYNLSLTKGSTSLSVVKYASAATTVGDYALIGGGSSTSSTNGRVVNAFDKSLTRTVPTALTSAMTNVCATTVGNYAIFLGPSGSSTCNAYDKDLTQTKLSSLSITNRNYISATTVGNHALFGGGLANDSGSSVVDAIDANLSHSLPTELSKARGRIAATTVGKYGLFAGGEATGSVNSNVVDAYDEALVRTIPNTLKTSRYNMAATTIGDFALFGGGRNSAGSYTSYNTVSAYTVA